ncbi:MAG: class I SAM-dependent methyltransferase [Phyllobacterium sp.]
MTGEPLKPDSEQARRFILANTALQSPPHVPEIKLYLADEAHELWLRTEDELATIGLPPPFWAFAWAGGQGVARYVLDNTQLFRSRTVLDFASGSGLVAIAAAKAGAAPVTATDIDAFCLPAMRLNAEANGVAFTPLISDVVDTDQGWDIVLAGDVFYDKAMTDRIVPWLGRLARRGALVIAGDPGRSYLPKDRLSELAVYTVPVTHALEDSEVKRTTVWRFA